MTTTQTALKERLANRLGPAGWTTDPDVIAPHLADWRGEHRGTTPLMAMPATTAEVAAVVRLCAEEGVAITPQGGNTGLVGAQIPSGEILLSLKRMNQIRNIDPLNDALIAEAGVVLASVHEAAAGADRMFPLSLGSQGSATIGGLISTNAGGVHVVRYGMMRDLVLGLEVVLADGTVLPALKALRKDNTGYDLKQLFIGAEGTLGVITAAALKLYARPQAHVVAVAGLMRAEDALELLHRAKARTGALVAFELMNRASVDLAAGFGARDPFQIAPSFLTLLEFEGAGVTAALEDEVEALLAEALDHGLIIDAQVARSDAQAKAYWRLRELIPAAHRPEGAQINLDISVPVSAVPRFLADAEAIVRGIDAKARIIAFGHAGDGNIHYTVLQPKGAPAAEFAGARIKQDVQAAAASMGGSISAEHGIGVSRRGELAHYKDQAQMGVMRAVKAALDPKGIFNPRAMFE
jgi:FAD/FMN-containing dehydrogenase